LLKLIRLYRFQALGCLVILNELSLYIRSFQVSQVLPLDSQAQC